MMFYLCREHKRKSITATRNLRAGQTRILSKDKTDNPKLCARKLADGRLSVYLEFYLGYEKKLSPKTGKETILMKRRQENLHLHLYDNPRTTEERQHNRDTYELAKSLRHDRERTRMMSETGYAPLRRKNVDFLQFLRTYLENYTKKDRAVVRQACRRFEDFLRDTPKYRVFANGLKPSQVDRDMILAFTDYLRTRSRGSGAWTVYARFKKAVKWAVEHDVLARNPCEGISIKVSHDTVTKAILSPEEIRALAGTPFPGGNEAVRRAFLFCLFTGLRFCDVRDLTFANIDRSNKILTFTQRKTDGHSAHSEVTIPLNESIMALAGEARGPDELIFPLPSYVTCWKGVTAWVRAAGIQKHVTWHCARHSFAVNILNNGANIKTVSSLLGHASISMTEKYLHVVDSQKRAAIDSLPSIDLSPSAPPPPKPPRKGRD